ncbi:MAG TPA: Rieske 2Fe-2S domain-containing protein [Streptosporangiaceae bacterium]
MTENNDTKAERADGADGAAEEPERAPRRVIGTPPPAESRRLLAADDGSDDGSGWPAPAEEINEEQARKAERVVALLFVISFLASLGFIAAYVLSGRNGGMHGIRDAMWSNYGLGGTMTIAFLAMAAGITVWFRRLMTAKQVVQQRGEMSSDPESRQAFTENFMQGAVDSGITRRPLLRRTLLLAAAPLGLAPAVLLRDLGPLPYKKLRHTYWGVAVDEARKQGKRGARLVVDGTYQPLRRSDFDSQGGMITVVPEGIDKLPNLLDELSKAATIIVNLPVNEFQPVKGRENWHVGGIVAYSKICTHVGCPAALYEQTTHHILCPCHQSTFDANRSAKVIFGPAARPLPQLPIGVDDQGYLIALSDYHEPVGPSFWERG